MSAPLVASKEVHAKVKFLLSEQIVCQETHEDVGDLRSRYTIKNNVPKISKQFLETSLTIPIMVTISLKGTSPSQGASTVTPSTIDSHILVEDTMVPKLITLSSFIFGSPHRSLSSSERKKEKTLP